MKNLSYGPSDIPQSSYNSFMFGLASFSGDKKVESEGGFHTCREGLLSKISTDLDKINTDKTHMLLRWDAGHPKALEEKIITKNNLSNQKWIERSVRLLHFYEKMAGWPITKMYKVKTNDNIKLYYFLSSRRWIKAPYLMSLYILLIRIGKFECFEDFKTYDDLVEIAKNLAFNKISNSYNNDENYIIKTFPYWKTIVENYGELFRKMKIEHYWSEERLRPDSYIGYEGIAYLSCGDTRNSTLYEKFMELHKKGGK